MAYKIIRNEFHRFRYTSVKIQGINQREKILHSKRK